MLAESEERRDEAAPEEGGEEVSIEDRLRELESQLAEEKAQKEAYLAGWQRTQADFVNYRRQVEQEREREIHERAAKLIRALLPVLDDLDRALGAVPERLSNDPWVQGIFLVADKFRALLKAQGVEPIEAVGKQFNPEYHEALMLTQGEEGVVIREMEKGYLMGDKVIRPTKAIVGSGGKRQNTDKDDSDSKEEV